MSDRTESILFLGCDLVGSTAYKQANPAWPRDFLGFYRQFPQMVGSQLTERGVSLDFCLWKAVGDELIFSVVVRHERHIRAAIDVWMAAMGEYQREVLDMKAPGLAVKGGAFVATIPDPDSEATIPRDPKSEDSDADIVDLNAKALRRRRTYTKYLYDYFGPSFDTGFRVLGQATERFFTLTVEAALGYARAYAETEAETEADHFVYRGAVSMKGVWGGRDYPLFSIDRHCDDNVNRKLAALNGRRIGLHAAADACQACVDSSGWPSRLYLPESGRDDFKRPAGDVLGKLKQSRSPEGAESLPSEQTDGSSVLPANAPMG